MKSSSRIHRVLARLVFGLSAGVLTAATFAAQDANPLSISQEARLAASAPSFAARLGRAVAISGDTALVATDYTGPQAGRGVFVFVRSGSGWTQQALLIPDNTFTNTLFGISVALFGDTAVIGASSDGLTDASPRTGSAYVFVRNGTTWTQQQRLMGSDSAANDQFGLSVAVSGNTTVIGAVQGGTGSVQDMGSAYVFVRSGNSWTQQAEFMAPPPVGLLTNDDFGYSVAVEGDTALIGSRRDRLDSQAGITGSAYVYVRDGSSWSRQARLTSITAGSPVTGEPGGFFGTSVALSGDTALVGSPFEDPRSLTNLGAAYVFTRSGSNWTQQARLVPGTPTVAGAVVATTVGLSGDIAVLGAALDDPAGAGNRGSAFVFARHGSSWAELPPLLASDGAAGNLFGTAVAASGDTILSTATDIASGGVGFAGAAYVYRIASDLGDAQDPGYPTLRASSGAQHFINGPTLGATVDAEPDGQPNSGATGDDIGGTDDEDGFAFGTLTIGTTGSLAVAVSNGPALLDGWIDFNDDGDWLDAGERIFTGLAVVSGSNALSFPVPATAVAGQTYARLRLSSAGVATPTGIAIDGEVEDELLTIALPTLSINDSTVTEGNSGTVVARFTVRLSTAVSYPVSVSYATSNSTATAGNDYVAATGTLTFPAGNTSQRIDIAVIGETLIEPDERFNITLSTPVSATIADGSGRGTIVSDDIAPPAPGIGLNVTSFNFGNVVVGQSSVERMLVVTSTGTLPLEIRSLRIAGNYSGSSACPAVLEPGASCTLTGSFRPTALGVRAGTVTITTNAADSPTVVQLSGTGV